MDAAERSHSVERKHRWCSSTDINGDRDFGLTIPLHFALLVSPAKDHGLDVEDVAFAAADVNFDLSDGIIDAIPGDAAILGSKLAEDGPLLQRFEFEPPLNS